MKKIVNIILIFVLCLAISGCNNEKLSNLDKTIPVVYLEITINPEFKLHLNDSQKVINIECLNDDAKAVNNNLNIIGKLCEDAIVELLNESKNQGFLKDDDKISITIIITDTISNKLDSWNKTVMDSVSKFLSQSNMDVDISFNAMIMESNSNTNHNNNIQNTDEYANRYIIDENGVTTVIDKDGNMIQTIHTEADGTIVTTIYDKNGNIISEERQNPNNSNQSLAGQTVTNIDEHGTKWIQTYDQNGKVELSSSEYQDGSWAKSSFKDGILLEHTTCDENGLLQTWMYNDGILKKMVANYNDGKRLEKEYDAKGTLIMMHEYMNNTVVGKTKFDSNGNKVYEEYYNSDGAFVERNYNPNGSGYEYYYAPDGTVWYSEFDENGKQDLSTHKQIK